MRGQEGSWVHGMNEARAPYEASTKKSPFWWERPEHFLLIRISNFQFEVFMSL